MNKEDIKRRVLDRIDRDDSYAAQVQNALDMEDDIFLMELILDVIGIVIDIGTSVWNWLKQTFGS
ncbi:MAG: hypothetical protein F6J87_04715 [Spirulina sp. SIO3F2]|nr:hypothetical protein [Spirulina sp. SIO3F2]